ncbi:hypothetical protein GCM10010129_57560 [Streptomyces fumigatiscleroticus]|nr:hypothetical protein GCM10010129_57560 [Streptomyces fumigatiscleroticus]
MAQTHSPVTAARRGGPDHRFQELVVVEELGAGQGADGGGAHGDPVTGGQAGGGRWIVPQPPYDGCERCRVQEYGGGPEQGGDGEGGASGEELDEAEEQALQTDTGQEPGAVGMPASAAGVGVQEPDDRQGECRPHDGGDGEEGVGQYGGGAYGGGAVTEARGEDAAGRDQGEVPEQAGGIAQFGAEGASVAGGLDRAGRQKCEVQGRREVEEHRAHDPGAGLRQRPGDDAGGHDGSEARGGEILAPRPQRRPSHRRETVCGDGRGLGRCGAAGRRVPRER